MVNPPDYRVGWTIACPCATGKRFFARVARRTHGRNKSASTSFSSSPLAARKRFLNFVHRYGDVHAGTFFLKQHEDARIAVGPTTVERFGQLLVYERGDP